MMMETKSASTRRSFLALQVPGLAALLLSSPLSSPRAAWGRRSSSTDRFLAAAGSGDLATVKTLLDREPGLLTARDDHGRTAFALALIAHQAAIAQLLRERGHRPDLHEAALALDWDLFDRLSAAQPEALNRHHPIGGTAMYSAAIGGAGSEIWHVYTHGGDPNARLRSEERVRPSPLLAAFDHPDLGTAEMTAATLLGNGADPNLPQPRGRTPLHAAAARGSSELIEMLIRKGADLGATDAAGLTAQEVARRAGHGTGAELLRRHHEIPRDCSSSRRAFDADGRPFRPPDLSELPLADRLRVVGFSHGSLEEVRRRVDARPELATAVATTTEGAVEAGAHTGRLPIVEYLLEKGAPYSIPTAVMRGDADRVRALLAEDPRRIHERGAHDFALLWYPVIGGGLIELAELLIDAGAEVERQHYLGTTALHWAAMRGQLEMTALLLEHGADVNRVGRKFSAEGATPLQHARQRGHDEVARLLQQRGARA